MSETTLTPAGTSDPAEPDPQLSIDASGDEQSAGELPAVSVIVPAYNESKILRESLATLYQYMEGLSSEYRWELVVVNDGSTDDTGEIADDFASRRAHVRVLHHRVNFNLGQALRYAFNTCTGDYVVTIDSDLSYSPDHIASMLAALRADHAKIALASPYMKGGSTEGIPIHRRWLSKLANRFLASTSGGSVSTLTGMVRAYDRLFLSSLDLKAMGTDINAEILYKAQVLGARVVEVPAHLDWNSVKDRAPDRKSKMSVSKGTSSYLFSGFIFRPVSFFVLPGLFLLLVSAVMGFIISWRFFSVFGEHTDTSERDITHSIGHVFNDIPQAFFIGGVSLLLGVQVLALGILASQNKRYFEDLFHLTTRLYRDPRNNQVRSAPMAEFHSGVVPDADPYPTAPATMADPTDTDWSDPPQ